MIALICVCCNRNGVYVCNASVSNIVSSCARRGYVGKLICMWGCSPTSGCWRVDCDILQSVEEPRCMSRIVAKRRVTL